MQRFRKILDGAPLALVVSTVVVLALIVMTQRAAGVRLGVNQVADVATATPTDIPTLIVVLPTVTLPVSIIATDTPLPPEPPTVTPGPPPTVAALVVAPLSLSLTCTGSVQGQPITITNTGTEEKTWTSGVSDPTFAVSPLNSTASGNSYLQPGTSTKTYIYANDPVGTHGSALIYEGETNGVLGPLAGTVNITCV